MVEVEFDPLFEKRFKKIKSNSLKIQLKKQIKKIVSDPEIGKPMMNSRKGTSKLYVLPFRLSYSYIKIDNKMTYSQT